MSQAQAPAGKSTIKVAVTASAGASIEWYDFFIYGTAAALVFPKLFFPPELPLFVAQIAAFSTFAVGFIARPIGGMLFGHFGDIHGRKRALVIAMLTMGIATTAVGLLPSYESVGALAPLMLVVLRFVQGLAVGGQWGGAALLAIESAPEGKRGYYGSFVQMGVPIGLVLANSVFLLVAALASPEAFAAWGWRIAFLLSIVLIFISIYVHFRIQEPADAAEPVDTAAPVAPPPAPRRSPLVQAIVEHPREILLAGGAFVANNTCFYVAITYAIAYGTATVGISKEVMLFAVMASSAAMIPILVLCGALSDRYGRRGIFMLGAVLAGLWGFALFPLIETGSTLLVTLGIMIEMFFLSMMYGPQAALFAELFPKNVRYSGASLGYQLGAVVGGGFAPIIATALYARFETSAAIAVYLAGMCLISFVSVVLLGRIAPGPRHLGAPA